VGLLSNQSFKADLIDGENDLSIDNLIFENLEEDFSVPWTIQDIWLSIALIILLTVGMGIVFFTWSGNEFLQNIGLVLTEIIYIMPVIFFLVKRKASWNALGFRRFDKSNLAMGCGLLVFAYVLVLLHNTILALFGITTQGDQIFQLFENLDHPLWLVFIGVVLAPLIEEIYFRGFLFGGFRKKFGWKKAALISAIMFSIAHVQVITLIPTFILGYLFAYMFYKSNSLWPGVLLHFFVNSMGFCLILTLSKISI